MIVVPCEARLVLYFSIRSISSLRMMCFSDVCFGPMNQGLSREEAEVEAKKALQHVGFKEKNFSKSPFELSGGQKKRVAIAGVLAMNPKNSYFG